VCILSARRANESRKHTLGILSQRASPHIFMAHTVSIRSTTFLLPNESLRPIYPRLMWPGVWSRSRASTRSPPLLTPSLQLPSPNVSRALDPSLNKVRFSRPLDRLASARGTPMDPTFSLRAACLKCARRNQLGRQAMGTKSQKLAPRFGAQMPTRLSLYKVLELKHFLRASISLLDGRSLLL
jgi:hypothetical protein